MIDHQAFIDDGYTLLEDGSYWKGKNKPIDLFGALTSGPVVRTPEEIAEHEAEREKLLGDYTEEILASLGITPERYVGWKESLGFAPTCDCPKRKEWMNKAHRWANNKLKKITGKD